MSWQSLFRTTTGLKINPADTTITLAAIPTVTIGRVRIYSGKQEELVSFTWTTWTPWATWTLTGCTRNLSLTADPVTGWTGLTWVAGSQVELVIMHDQIFDKTVWGTITWNLTLSGTINTTQSLKIPIYADATARDAAIPSPSNGMLIYNTALWIIQQYIAWAWADNASWTTSNASTTVAGKVEIATDSELAAWTNTGWTWAYLSPQIKSLNYNFWDWSDGSVTISVNTTLTRDMYYQDLTVNTWIVLNPAWYAIYVLWTLTLSGTAKIKRNWTNWNNGSSSTGWTATASLATGTCWVSGWGAAGWDWGNGAWVAWSAWVSPNPSYATTWTVWKNGWSWGNGTGGGYSAGGAAWVGGTATQWTLYNVIYSINRLLAMLRSPSRGQSITAAWTQYLGMPTSWGGGGGGWPGGAQWGGGGAGWGNWGIIFIYANALAWTWTIEAMWGTGWNWANWPIAGAGGGGGGGGGNGWIVVIIYSSGSVWTNTLAGGAGWTGWAPWAGGGAWNSGQSGTTGQAITINV